MTVLARSFGVALAIAACVPAIHCTPPSASSPSSSSSSPPSLSPCRAKVSALLAQMTLPEKLGQMVQAERKYVAPGDIVKYGLGSILSGGGSAPGRGTAAEWADMVDAFHAEARTSRLKIPLVYGVDAVHGHNNVAGATIFPHAIGLGCARDPELALDVARATAMEVAGTGVDWTFAPLVGPGRDPRWGRTYETFSEDPALSATLGAAAIRGYQGDRLGSDPLHVIACAKHFAGDGATSFGTSHMDGGVLDRGDVRLDDATFRALAVTPYRAAIAAGVGTVMVSFSAHDGVPMHANKHLVTDVLKGELGFSGLVVSDWSGLREMPGTYYEQVVASVNAGIDMTMDAEHPTDWKEFLDTLAKAVAKGDVTQARIDDAVTRVLGVKCEAGLFEKGPTDRKLTALVGSAEHHALARRAARASMVLLQNEGQLLPLTKTARVVVMGTGADSLTRQAGGWTLAWQGAEDKAFPGTTILQGIRAAIGDPARTIYRKPGEAVAPGSADVAVLVASEPSYAEWFGDSRDLALPAVDLAALDALARAKLPTVVVLLTGRPVIIEPHLGKARAWLAAWLPGSEGGAVADVLFGDAAPSGKLAHSWPRRIEDLPARTSEPMAHPLFPFGHGLSFAR
ncbi:MAG: beta-N-acetylhexosaminidase [Myxococcaceae bacterium]|nr:beta-N-acetylhexosaminidase [Myxococcaceae bacterium]